MVEGSLKSAARFIQQTIAQKLTHGLMQESVIYQSIQKDEKRAIALNFLREGLSIETVARGTGLSIEEVQQLQQQLNESAQS
jgi:predicted transposase YdaD